MDLLEVSSLTVEVAHSPLRLLRDIGFSVRDGEIVGLVGESGSGKTMISLAVMGLLPPGVEWKGGSVRLGGRELAGDHGRIERHVGDVTMIFQDPRGALNPTMRVGRQIARVLRIAQDADARSARDQAVEMLSHVGIPGAARIARAFPHQLSGGMCQRVMIAMALGTRPRVLIADEPTTALDVTIQAQIFDLIRALVSETGCGVLFITHDLAAVAEMCDRVVVLYGGQVMETGTTGQVFENPQNPYTRFLFDAAERTVDPASEERGADHSLAGCRFAHRCAFAHEACADVPPFVEVEAGHCSACVLHVEETVGAS